MEKSKVKYKMVVIGGSAGSLDVILKIFSNNNLPTNVFYILVVHRKNDNDSVFSNLISKRTNLKVKEVEDKDAAKPGCVYIAPADYHLLLENEESFSLDSSEKVSYSRPSIDVTFESAAYTFGASAIGILLSGANADGANGLQKIKLAGGFTIVQDPQTAEVDYMPRQAIEKLHPNAIVKPDDIADCLHQLI